LSNFTATAASSEGIHETVRRSLRGGWKQQRNGEGGVKKKRQQCDEE
jgi:hypothetical protein